MKFVFQGTPIAKMRHRTVFIKGKCQVYDKQHSLVGFAKMELLSQIFERYDLNQDQAFDIDLTFYLPYPKKLRKSEIKAIADGSMILHANAKPDIDNLCKFYLDVANEILYPDDKQIISIKAKKCYDLIPRTEIIITPIEK